MAVWLHVCVRAAVVGWGETHLARLQITIKYLLGLGFLRLGAVVAVPVPVGRPGGSSSSDGIMRVTAVG